MGPENNMKTNTVVRHTLTHLFIMALGLFMIYPILWMIVSSFKPNNMIFSDPGLIPKVVTFENYISGWKGYAGISFARFFANSLYMCIGAVVGNLIACTMAAYAFGRLKFAGMKSELLVIADQHAAVNTFSGLVHTACQVTEVGLAQRPLFQHFIFVKV